MNALYPVGVQHSPHHKQTHIKKYVIKDNDDLIKVLYKQKELPDVYLGEILLEASVINQQQLNDALQKQRQELGKHLGRILIDLGLVTAEQVNFALARKFGIPCVKLEDFKISPHILNRIPADLALQYNIMPLGEVDDILIVAMENPLDLSGIGVLRFNTNLKIEPVMASAQDIALTLSKYYSKFDEDEALEDTLFDSVNIGAGLQSQDSAYLAEAEAKKKPIVRLVNAIILQGVIRGASDINIRPEQDRVNVYYRVDGKLQYSRTLHRSLLPPLVSRIKIIGQMDISERRLPQDGHARLERGEKCIDLRISVIPTVNGESVVIRILDKDVGLKSFSNLGLRSQEKVQVSNMLSRSHGLFLVTGPTGSGKSTTMYALLEEVKKDNPHILTVEDPVEYDMESVEQVQILPSKGLTFAETLKHFLRHDPDVIMVGEIRDNETAAIANKAALTGHLVLSTLHTNDAPSAVTRLLDMGVEPYLLSSTLLGVMAQRLIRLNCQHCIEEDHVEDLVRKNFHLTDSEVFYRGVGCAACNYTGYHGRILVTEVLVVTPEIVELINTGASTQKIADMAIQQGMVRLIENAIRYAKAGKTSINEVMTLRL